MGGERGHANARGLLLNVVVGIVGAALGGWFFEPARRSIDQQSEHLQRG